MMGCRSAICRRRLFAAATPVLEALALGPTGGTYGACKRASTAYYRAHAVLFGTGGPLAGWMSSASLHLDDFTL
jgi:hypothetical protein